MKFWEKWYFPANAVLYIVGDYRRPVEEVKALIEQSFGAVPPGRERLPGAEAAALTNGSSNGSSPNSNGAGAVDGPLKQKHKVWSALSKAPVIWMLSPCTWTVYKVSFPCNRSDLLWSTDMGVGR